MHAAVQDDAVHYGGHGQFADAGVQEGSGEIAGPQCRGLFQEAVGLVAVGQVGRSDNHIADVSGQITQHVGRGRACCHAGLVHHLAEIQFGQAAA